MPVGWLIWRCTLGRGCSPSSVVTEAKRIAQDEHKILNPKHEARNKSELPKFK